MAGVVSEGRRKGNTMDLLEKGIDVPWLPRLRVPLSHFEKLN
jgi:hypothetical protein